MNITQQGVIALLKAAITQQALPLPDGFDLEKALGETARHHMDALIFEGAVQCGISRRLPVMQKLFQSYCRMLQRSESQMLNFARICDAFEENGISYMPLKGCEMKELYPKPELRYMGDADILIREEQRNKISTVMEGLGFTCRGGSDHELIWRTEGLLVELHKRLIPSYNKDFFAYFGDGWSRAKQHSGSRYAMTAEDTWIFQFAHFAKHYRDGGVGCRYVADLWVYRNANPRLDEGYVSRELEKLKLLEFYENTLRVIGMWFEDGPGDAVAEFMTDYIFASGSWGREESKLLSRTVRDRKHSALGFSGRLVYLWTTAFPGVLALQEKYTILRKHPWMLPLVWLWRPFYKVLFEDASLKKQRQNMESLRDDKLRQRQRELRYVGLDYNF